MRVLFAILARFRADQPGGFNASITAGDDMALAWESTMRTVRRRWRDAIILGTTWELAESMRATLAGVRREGGKQPLLAAATVALLVEVAALTPDENNGTSVCWVDNEAQTVTAEGATGGPLWRRALIGTATRLGCRLEIRPWPEAESHRAWRASSAASSPLATLANITAAPPITSARRRIGGVRLISALRDNIKGAP
jgi:hypothetical protein